MFAVVVYREHRVARAVVDAAREFFGMAEEAIKGAGRVLVYEGRRTVYFVRTKRAFELHPFEVGADIKNALGEPDVVVSINPHVADQREGIFVHSAGNITGANVLGVNAPRNVVPTDPGAIGALARAVHRFSEELGMETVLHIEATHDLPEDSPFSYLSFEVKGDVYVDLAALSLVAAIGVETYFKPYLTVGMSYYADEFVPVTLKKKKVPAYHVPFYLAHHLDRPLLKRLKKEGVIDGVALGRGVPRDKLPF